MFCRYYAVCFLNTLLLSHDERHLASRLLSVYFTFFKVTKIYSYYALLLWQAVIITASLSVRFGLFSQKCEVVKI